MNSREFELPKFRVSVIAEFRTPPSSERVRCCDSVYTRVRTSEIWSFRGVFVVFKSRGLYFPFNDRFMHHFTDQRGPLYIHTPQPFQHACRRTKSPLLTGSDSHHFTDQRGPLYTHTPAISTGLPTYKVAPTFWVGFRPQFQVPKLTPLYESLFNRQ